MDSRGDIYVGEVSYTEFLAPFPRAEDCLAQCARCRKLEKL
jgi:hypothetical protein